MKKSILKTLLPLEISDHDYSPRLYMEGAITFEPSRSSFTVSADAGQGKPGTVFLFLWLNMTSQERSPQNADYAQGALTSVWNMNKRSN